MYSRQNILSLMPLMHFLLQLTFLNFIYTFLTRYTYKWLQQKKVSPQNTCRKLNLNFSKLSPNTLRPLKVYILAQKLNLRLPNLTMWLPNIGRAPINLVPWRPGAKFSAYMLHNKSKRKRNFNVFNDLIRQNTHLTKIQCQPNLHRNNSYKHMLYTST